MHAQPRNTSQPDRRIWAIAGPAIVSNVTAASIGLVDSWAVGHLPNAEALAGLAIGAYGISMLHWSLGFLRMGTTGLIAQTHGARQTRRLTRIAVRAALLGVFLGLALVALKAPLTQMVLALLDADGAVQAAGKTYLSIRLWSSPFFLIKVAVIGLLIGLQRTDVALYIEAGVNLLNAGLTVLLVTGLGYGVAGAAWGSLIAEIAGGLAAGAILIAFLRPTLIAALLRAGRFWRWQAFVQLLAVNGWLFVRTVLLIAGFGLYLAQAETLGPATLAACHIVLNFYVLQALTLDALAYAAEALVGEAIGQGSRQAMRFWTVRTSYWALALSLLYMTVFALLGEPLLHFFTDQPSVRAAAQPLYLWIALTPPVAVWCYQFDGIFIGAARAQPMFWTMGAALGIFYALSLWWVPAYGASGLCAAFLAFFGLRGLGLALAYVPMERAVTPARVSSHAIKGDSGDAARS
ncbi:MAG: MATE family efflux transporter [Pseudomonadota bacterium]